MLFTKQIMTLIAVATLGGFLVQVACDTSNSNFVDCYDADCDAACRTQGFESGACQAEICECVSNGETSYLWTSDAGSGEDSDSEYGGS